MLEGELSRVIMVIKFRFTISLWSPFLKSKPLLRISLNSFKIVECWAISVAKIDLQKIYYVLKEYKPSTCLVQNSNDQILETVDFVNEKIFAKQREKNHSGKFELVSGLQWR